ncbi:isochorismatase family protein [Bosea thiooxidans]|nr:isochorismatase family protein [Bosea sp. (in: a-proteobacteria)]
MATGVNTSGCIRATVIDSFQRGYRTIVPEDCAGDVERRYADVVTLGSVLGYLRTLG